MSKCLKSPPHQGAPRCQSVVPSSPDLEVILAQGAIPASALTVIVKPFRRLSELLVPDTPLSPAEVAELRQQLPCLDDFMHQQPGP